MPLRLIPGAAGSEARTGTDCDLVAWGLVIGHTPIDDDADTDASIAYVLTLDGDSAGSGDLAWEALGYEDAWVARFSLPATPGILHATAAVAATVDGDDATATLECSIEVT